MKKEAIELRFVFSTGISERYQVFADLEVTESAMRNTVGGIMQLFQSGDSPVLTDVNGTIFCIPNKDSLIAIECRKVDYDGTSK